MPSRQDQLHSYQFSVQRVVSALVMRDTDPAQSPFRRAASSTVASICLAVVIAAGFGVYGVFSERGDVGWQQDGTVVIEDGTGAVYVYRNEKLHPALNLASALLASGQSQPTTKTVSRKSLAGIARGLTVGVPDLPDSLPDADGLLGAPWSLCSLSGEKKPVAAVAVGDAALAAKGRPLGDDALFVQAAGQFYLLWHGRLFSTDAYAAQTLGGGSPAVSVPVAFVNPPAKGQPLGLPKVDAPGAVSAALPNYRNGQVLKIKDLDGAVKQYAVVLDDGLALITAVQATLLVGGYHSQWNIPAEETVDKSRLSELDKSPRNLVPDPNDQRQPPAVMPTIAQYGSGALCAVFRDETGVVEARLDVPVNVSGRPATVARAGNGSPYADYVLVPSGQGAIVAAGTTLSLVTDQGVRFAAAKAEVLSTLGYSGKGPLKLPPKLVDVLPEGPGLDPQTASAQLALG
ncbi:type VII secretion protein EccB [Catellatospora sp. KI3]|uniref:type VII secretion protein EccB n=1 Tax=Catellatospora sp. KI3 TaxID=3041620 RepID=UPI00248285DA|nr:type VII secretion protein EccB [Catellatospora sp. KI3]MDI1461912.1 type VII secretion protein EccB [Catellatospora sp. KI3]